MTEGSEFFLTPSWVAHSDLLQLEVCEMVYGVAPGRAKQTKTKVSSLFLVIR